MRHQVGQSVASVNVSEGRFTVRGTGGRPDAAPVGGKTPRSRARSCSSVVRRCASRCCAGVSSNWSESVQLAPAWYDDGTASDTCVFPDASTQRQTGVAPALADANASATTRGRRCLRWCAAGAAGRCGEGMCFLRSGGVRSKGSGAATRTARPQLEGPIRVLSVAFKPALLGAPTHTTAARSPAFCDSPCWGCGWRRSAVPLFDAA